MASVSFYLNRNKIDKKGRCPIILQCDHNKQRFKYYTGEKIDPKYWSNSKTCFIKPSYNDDSTLDTYLKGLVAKIEKIVRDAKNDDKIITSDFIKRKFLEDSSHKTVINFISLFEKYVSSSTNTRTPGTIKNYNNVLSCLKKFQEEKSYNFEFDLISKSFYDKYVDFLITEKNFSNNTIGKHVKTIKSFLSWATENKFNKNLDFKKFKVIRESIEIIYLTDNELKAIYNLEIEDQYYNNARDLFCLACYTGLRFSDISLIDNSSIFDNEIHIRTQKTKDILTIPLIPQALSILQKHNYSLPVFSNQELNLALKVIGKEAKINQEVTIHKYRGAERINEKLPKYKFITTHTARRTFITLSLEKGIRPEVVMSITGHKDYKTFKTYIKITDTIKKESLLNAWK